MVYVVTHNAKDTVCAHSLTREGALAWIAEACAHFGDGPGDFTITSHTLV